MTQMAPDHSDKLEFTFESDAAASFLVIKCDANVLEYQVLMLEHNSIRHVIPVNVVRKEGVASFYYNITSKISLSFFLNRRKFSREEFLKFLLHITTAVNDSAGYLLTDSNFVFNPEHIYISPETLEPVLVYVPVSQEEGFRVTLQGFISDLLLQHINIDGFGSGNFVQRILAAVKSEMFHIKGLIRLLSELLYGQEPGNGDTGAAERETVEGQGGENPAKYKKEQKWGKRVRGVCDGKAETRKEVSEDKAPEGRAPEVKAMINEAAERKAMINGAAEGKAIVSGAADDKAIVIGAVDDKMAVMRRAPRVTILAILAQIVMGGAIYLFRDFLNNASDNPTASYAAVAMIVLAVEVLLFKKLSAARLINMEAGKENLQNTAADSENTLEHVYIDSARVVSEAASELAAVSLNQTNRASCRTELLGSNTKGARLLKSTVKQSGEEDIYIDKDDFIIGRLAGHVDYVLKNSAVGKLHAQLIYRNNTCYIKDLNSVNGTFINSKRIDSNKEFELKENDRLQLANSEYVFIEG